MRLGTACDGIRCVCVVDVQSAREGESGYHSTESPRTHRAQLRSLGALSIQRRFARRALLPPRRPPLLLLTHLCAESERTGTSTPRQTTRERAGRRTHGLQFPTFTFRFRHARVHPMNVGDVRICLTSSSARCGRRCRARCVTRATVEFRSVSEQQPKALVVGAGVIGLTTAVRLLQLGFETRVIAHKRAEDGVSFGAGAIWEAPPFKAFPRDRATAWALTSREVFDALPTRRGVFQRRVHYLYRQRPSDEAPRDLTPPAASHWRDLHIGQAPPEVGRRYSFGYSHVAPVVYMQTYLHFLQQLCSALGGSLNYTSAPLATLEDAVKKAYGNDEHEDLAVVVNCCGLGAARLGDVADSAVIPVRGIKVYVDAPDVSPVGVYIAEPRDAATSFTSITPCGDTGIWACSGVAQPGETSLEVTQDEVESIMERCVDLLPALKGKPVVRTWAGLRPLRQAAAGGIRLAPDRMRDGTLLVHNYGHGGAGVVTSWGCAQDVAVLAATEVSDSMMLCPVSHMPEAFADVPLLRTDTIS